MNIKDLQKNYVRKPSVEIGTHTLKFEGIDFRIDKNGDVQNFFIKFEGYNSIYLKFFEKDNNYQLDFLLKQLGIDNLAEASIRAALGKPVIVTAYERETEEKIYTNYSFDPDYSESVIE